MLEVTVSGDNVNIVFSKNLVNDRDLMEFIEKVKVKNLISKSQLTEADVENLDEELKTDWWKKNRHRFLGKFE